MPSALRIKELRDLNDNVMMSDGALTSNVDMSNVVFPSEFKRSTVQKSNGHNESLGNIFFDSPAYVEWYDLNVGDKILLHFVGSSQGTWWNQGRWNPEGYWGCYIDTNGGTNPNFGNTWSANDGDYASNTYEKRILFGSDGNVSGNGDTSTFAFDTNSFTRPSNLKSDHNYYIQGDVNNLNGNIMSTDMSRIFLFEVPSGFAGSYRFHRVVYVNYWQDISGTFYPFGGSSSICYMNSWKLNGVL